MKAFDIPSELAFHEKTNMNSRLTRLRGWALTLLSGAILAGCGPGTTQCDLPISTVATEVRVTSISTPPGGGGSREFRVRASGFHPNAIANLRILNFPKSNDAITAQLTMDGSGSANWATNAPLLLATDPTVEPNTTVTTTVAELASTCLGIGTIKHAAFMRIN